MSVKDFALEIELHNGLKIQSVEGFYINFILKNGEMIERITASEFATRPRNSMMRFFEALEESGMENLLLYGHYGFCLGKNLYIGGTQEHAWIASNLERGVEAHIEVTSAYFDIEDLRVNPRKKIREFLKTLYEKTSKTKS